MNPKNRLLIPILAVAPLWLCPFPPQLPAAEKQDEIDVRFQPGGGTGGFVRRGEHRNVGRLLADDRAYDVVVTAQGSQQLVFHWRLCGETLVTTTSSADGFSKPPRGPKYRLTGQGQQRTLALFWTPYGWLNTTVPQRVVVGDKKDKPKR